MAYSSFNSTVYAHADVLSKMSGKSDDIFSLRYNLAKLPLAKANLCSENFSKCGMIFAKYATYELPKTLLDSTFWLISKGKDQLANELPSPLWVTEKISYAGQNIRHYTPAVVTESICHINAKILNFFNATIIEKMPGNDILQSIHNTESPRHILNNILNEVTNFPDAATKWITEGKASGINHLDKNNLNSFVSTELIGPAIMQVMCLERTFHHLSQAIDHFQSLKNFNEVNVKFYLFENSDKNTVTRYTTDLHSRKHLLLNAFVETLFAGAWGMLSLISHQEIYNAVKEASGSSEKAFLVANAIFIGGMVGPKIFGWAYGKFQEKPIIIDKGVGYPTHMIPQVELIGLFPLEEVTTKPDNEI